MTGLLLIHGISYGQNGITKDYDELLCNLPKEISVQCVHYGDLLDTAENRLVASSSFPWYLRSLRNLILRYLPDALTYSSINRQNILVRVQSSVEAFQVGTELVIVGHSLGSVIALDYCLTHDFRPKCLITMGSPIALYSLRFGDFGRAVLSNWINLWSRWDWVSWPLHSIYDSAQDVEIFMGFGPWCNCGSKFQVIFMILDSKIIV